jgi:hypothetical protein
MGGPIHGIGYLERLRSALLANWAESHNAHVHNLVAEDLDVLDAASECGTVQRDVDGDLGVCAGNERMDQREMAIGFRDAVDGLLLLATGLRRRDGELPVAGHFERP